jgi:hypothetical protein
MEPLTSTAFAVATLILNKAYEKVGEKLGETVSQKVGKLIKIVRKKPLPQVAVIEKSEQPVNYEQAVLELESAMKADPELAQVVEELAMAVKANPELVKKLQDVASVSKNEPNIIQNYTKLAEKIGVVVQGGGAINIDTMSF